MADKTAKKDEIKWKKTGDKMANKMADKMAIQNGEKMAIEWQKMAIKWPQNCQKIDEKKY